MPKDFKPVNIVNIDDQVVELNLMTVIGTEEGEINAQSFADEITAINNHGGFSDITTFLNGPGGSVIEGLGIFHSIRDSKIPVTTHVTGVAASMHGILAFAGKKIRMNDFAKLMIHKPHNGTDVDPSPEEQKAIDALTDSLVTILVARTGKSVAQINKMLNEGDTWLDAKTALAEGYIDEIVKAKKHRHMELAAIAAKFTPTIYNGTTLANMLNSRIDSMVTDSKTRGDIISEMGREAKISASTVQQILKSTPEGRINCPPIDRLEGFARALNIPVSGIRTAAESDGCNYDTTGNHIDLNAKIHNMEGLNNVLGLQKEANEEAVINAVQKIMKDLAARDLDLEESKEKLEKAESTIQAQTTEIKAFKDATDLLNKEQLDVTLDQAVKDGKIEKKDVDSLKASFKDNLPGLQMVFKTLRTKAPTINNQLNGGNGGNGASDDPETPSHLTKEEKEMGYREWDKKDHKGLKALLKSNPEYVKGMYKAKYGIEMSAALISQLS